MQITKCDRCGAEIEQGKPKFKVFIENSAPGVFRETEEVIDDLCSTCRMQLREFFHPTEPVPVFLNTDKVRKEAEEDFWATHDPSGGDLPPEDDENDEKSVGGGYEVDPRKDESSGTAAGRETEKGCKSGPRKDLRIAKSRLVREGDLCGDAHFSGDGI